MCERMSLLHRTLSLHIWGYFSLTGEKREKISAGMTRFGYCDPTYGSCLQHSAAKQPVSAPLKDSAGT
jgi:hypothetical protein